MTLFTPPSVQLRARPLAPRAEKSKFWPHLWRLVAAFALVLPTVVKATPTVPAFPCGGSPPQMIPLLPVPKLSNPEFTDQGADCAMWQTFFYLNWPAMPGQPGVPNKAAVFGAPGTTVWETFKTSEQVFLPNGAKPQPWGQAFRNTALPGNVSSQVAAGKLRLLDRTSKVSSDVAHHLQTSTGLLKSGANIPLDQMKQADLTILYDQQKNPVYYDVAMNRTQFDYIVSNGLYNADTQAAYAGKTNIVLPTGSIEVKAAWKILTPAEAGSGRFHTATGFVPAASGGGAQTVTIGMVGMHVFASGGPQSAGLWATFYQVDNAPVQGTTPAGTYSFNNPASSVPVNSTSTNPTQVVQVIPDTPLAARVSAQARKVIIEGNPQSPWQYYSMIDSQWSRSILNLTSPVPLTAPLNAGTVSTATLISPVLETYLQTPGTSCLGCHSFATTATPNSSIASGFSFMLGNAKSARAPKPPVSGKR